MADSKWPFIIWLIPSKARFFMGSSPWADLALAHEAGIVSPNATIVKNMFHRRMGFRARFLRINYASSREAGTSSRLGAALLNSALRVRRNSYITKHSTAKGGKPRKPGAGISKIFQP